MMICHLPITQYRFSFHLGAISLKVLGGKFAPKLVYFVLRKELLTFSEMAPWSYQHTGSTSNFIYKSYTEEIWVYIVLLPLLTPPRHAHTLSVYYIYNHTLMGLFSERKMRLCWSSFRKNKRLMKVRNLTLKLRKKIMKTQKLSWMKHNRKLLRWTKNCRLHFRESHSWKKVVHKQPMHYCTSLDVYMTMHIWVLCCHIYLEIRNCWFKWTKRENKHR